MSEESSSFHEKAFQRVDDRDDATYFETCDKDFSMDQGGRLAVAALCRATLSPEAEILDLMAGPQTALPDEIAFPYVTDLDVSENLMQGNKRLASRVVFDLNNEAPLPFPDAHFDAVLLCDGLPYLTHPQYVISQAERVLRPGGALVVSFSDRFYPRKAFAMWQALEAEDRVRLVTLFMTRAGLTDLDTGDVTPPEDLTAWQDTVHAVIGRKQRDA